MILSKYWLIEEHVLTAWKELIIESKDSYVPSNRVNAAVYSVSDGVATIGVEGVLTARPDWFLDYIGEPNTIYSDIIESARRADRNPSVNSVQLLVNSPGGEVDGLFNAMKAVKSISKPTTAIVEGTAASAAYGLAACCDSIQVTGEGDRLGSVGVAVSAWVWDPVVNITNTDSPNKRPDLKTEEGKKVVQAELDEIYNIFSGYIAEGRGITKQQVSERFGKGSVVLADSAISRGMADGYFQRNLNMTTKDENMPTAEQLKAEGASEERQRVLSHLRLAKTSGCYDVALTAIESGVGLTEEIIQKHMTAGMERAKAEAIAAAVEPTKVTLKALIDQDDSDVAMGKPTTSERNSDGLTSDEARFLTVFNGGA